jgi:hypothetical protein
LDLKSQILAIFAMLFLSGINAQVPIANDSRKDSTTYKLYFPNKITLRTYFINTSNFFNFTDESQNINFSLNPNKQNQIGLSAAFRSLVISYSFTPGFLSENRDNGNSQLRNLNLRTFLGQWMINFQLYKEKGFFIDIPDLSVSEYFPDFRTLKIGGTASYIFNKNFSYRAIISQDEKQVKSAGTFMPNFFVYYTDYDLVAEGIDEHVYSYDLGIAPAYYYNFVPTKNLLISAGGSVGMGANITKSNGTTLTTLLTELNFRGSIVYDKNNLYAGAHYSYLILNHNFDRSTYIEDDIPYLQLFIGYRFDAPKFMVRAGNDINDKIGL